MTATRRLGRRVRDALRALAVAGARAAVRRLPAPVAVVLREELEVIERLDYDKREIFLSISSSVEHAIRTHACAREPETVAWIEGFLRPGDVLFDIGANVGTYALVAAAFTDGAARVYAFEPGFASFAALCRNVALNRCQDAVIPLNLALADVTTVGDFNYSDLRAGAAWHGYRTTTDFRGRPFTPVLRQPVVSYRIDDLVRLLPVPVPNLLKLDVDGTELAILRGATNTLADGRVRSVLVEVEPDAVHRDEIRAFLASRGFRALPPGRPDTNNAVFVRGAA